MCGALRTTLHTKKRTKQQKSSYKHTDVKHGYFKLNKGCVVYMGKYLKYNAY